MAEPRDFAYETPEYRSTTSPPYEKWNNMTPCTGQLPAAASAESPQERSTYCDTSFQTALSTTADPQFDGAESEWSSTENSRPISTRSSVAVQSQGSDASFDNATNPIQNPTWFASVDAADNAAQQGNFYHSQAYSPTVAGDGQYNHCRFGSAGSFAPSADSPHHYRYLPSGTTQCQYPQFRPNYATVPQRFVGYNQNVPFQSQPIYESASPSVVPHLGTAGFNPTCGMMPMGQYLAPVRIPIPANQQVRMSVSGISFGQRPPLRISGEDGPISAINKTRKETTTTTSTFPVTCYTCRRQYTNEKALHDHWLRVHVLGMTESGKTSGKRKHSGEAATSVSSAESLIKQQRMEGVTQVGQLDINRGGNSFSSFGDGILLTNDQLQSNTALDLSMKTLGHHGVPGHGLRSASSQLLRTDGQQQRGRLGQDALTLLGGRTVETKPHTLADCLSVRKGDLNLSFILPPGALPDQIKTQSGQGQAVDGSINRSSSHSSPEKAREPETIFCCPECPKTYTSRRSLQKHKKTVHSSGAREKKPKASVFEDVAAMEQLPYQCPSCPKRFLTEKLLKQHLTFHRKAEGTKK